MLAVKIPLSIGNVIRHSFKTYVELYKPLLFYAFLLTLVSLIPAIAQSIIDTDHVVQPATQAAEAGIDLWDLLHSCIIFLIYPIFNILMFYKGYHLTRKKREVTSQDLIAQVKEKYLFVLGAMALYMLAIAVGLILLGVPGIFMSLMWLFYLPSIVIDNHNLLDSLRHSWQIVWCNWWRTFFVFLFAFAVPNFILFGVIEAVGVFLPDIIDVCLQLIAATFLVPLFVSVTLVQYNDLKLRKLARPF